MDKYNVAPFAGAWIEIDTCRQWALQDLSLPSRERGLKFLSSGRIYAAFFVAPFAGAWIEISKGTLLLIQK